MRRCVKNKLALDKDGGTMEQILSTHRNILAQCMEWQAPIYVNFGDFRKAFDRVIREKLGSSCKSMVRDPRCDQRPVGSNLKLHQSSRVEEHQTGLSEKRCKAGLCHVWLIFAIVID